MKPTPTPVQVFDVLGEKLELFRCPKSTITAEVLDVLDRARTGYIRRLPPAEVRRLPAGLVGAVEWVTSVLEEKRGGVPHE